MSCNCGLNNYYSSTCHAPVDFCSCDPCGNVGGAGSGCNICPETYCSHSLAEDLCKQVNRKVVISIGGCRICVIVCCVANCLLKAVDYNTGYVYYFNVNRIDSVEEVLPY